MIKNGPEKCPRVKGVFTKHTVFVQCSLLNSISTCLAGFTGLSPFIKTRSVCSNALFPEPGAIGQENGLARI